MLWVSSGSIVPFRIPEKQAHFFRVNSPESGLQPSSEKLVYRYMEMFETGESSMGRKFPDWELHPQSQGVSSTLPGGGRWQKMQAQEGGEGWSCPGSAQGWEILHLQGAWGTLTSAFTSACAPRQKCIRQFKHHVLLLGVLRLLKHGGFVRGRSQFIFNTSSTNIKLDLFLPKLIEKEKLVQFCSYTEK